MRVSLTAFGFAVLMAFVSAAWSQDTKVRVSVSHSGEDSVGKQFAYAVREAIRGSNGYRLVNSDESGLQVNIVVVAGRKLTSKPV